MIWDWQRGKIAYFVQPSKEQEEEAEKIVKPSYNPALLQELHKKEDDDLLDLDDVAPVVDEIDQEGDS